MAYHKRDHLYPSNNRRETTVILTKRGVLETCAEEDDPSEPLAPDRSSEFIDTACDAFYAIRDFAESQGLPLLQLCRFPDFLDFVKKSPKKSGT